MKKSLTHLFCGAALALTGTLMADGAEKSVVVIMTDGSQRGETLANVDRITLGTSALTLESVGGASQTVDYADIDRVLIGAEWSAIQQITAPGEVAVWPTATDGPVNISGLQPGESVTVYDLKGATVATAAATTGVTTVSLGSLPTGIYILTARNQSVKIVKK